MIAASNQCLGPRSPRIGNPQEGHAPRPTLSRPHSRHLRFGPRMVEEETRTVGGLALDTRRVGSLRPQWGHRADLELTFPPHSRHSFKLISL
jgi:hypothetical protein